MVPVFEKNVVKLSEFWKQRIVNGNSAEVNAAADLARTVSRMPNLSLLLGFNR